MTKSVNPTGLAVLPLAPFVEHLHRYLYEISDTNTHPALGESPRDAYLRGFQNTGSRFQRLIRYDRDFMIATMPSTLRGLRWYLQVEASKSTTSPIGATPWSRRFAGNECQFVRFDPFDLGTAFAFIDGRWVQCHSEHYQIFASSGKFVG